MSARRPTTRTTLSCLACLTLAGGDTRPTFAGRVDLPTFRAASPIEAALSAAIAASSSPTSARPTLDERASARSCAAARILALAHDEHGARSVDPCVTALIVDCAPFLECLPLQRLKDVRIDARELRLEFDVSAGERLHIDVPERELLALGDDEDGNDGAGTLVRVRSEARQLFLGDTLRLELDGGRIRGVFDGDLEVRVGPFDVDLELRTERGPARPARDPCGRPLLALDAAGHPRRENGRWVVQTYELWIVLEALGHRVEVGVPLEDGGASTQSERDPIPARPPSARARCSAWNRP